MEMTGLSLLCSIIAKVEIREYSLLANILAKDPITILEEQYQIGLGWLIHIILGALFLGLYEILWRIINVERTLLWALIYGTVIDVLGILS